MRKRDRIYCLVILPPTRTVAEEEQAFVDTLKVITKMKVLPRPHGEGCLCGLPVVKVPEHLIKGWG